MYLGLFFFTLSLDSSSTLLSWTILKFVELCPPHKDTKAKTQEFMRLPIEKRSFGVVVDCPSEDLSTFAVVKDFESINMSTCIFIL